jgi:glycosyltransferase involved in cell wall biosynthesis
VITVFTCTYNRAQYLPDLYLSLQKQTIYDFEWVIVDDGSIDNTEEYVNSILANPNEFKVKYKKIENGGKHRAINRGLDMVEGSYVFLVDSDDELTPDAIEKVLEWTSMIDNDSSIVGVAGLMENRQGKISGSYPKAKKYSKYIDARCVDRNRYHLTGDKAVVFRTEIMKQYPFPEIDGEKFILEGVVWNKMSLDGYKIRWFPKVIYRYDYLEGGLTNNNMKLIDNWKGYTLTTKITIEASKGIYKLAPIARYVMYGKKKGLARKDIMTDLNIDFSEYIIGDLLQKIHVLKRGIV